MTQTISSDYSQRLVIPVDRSAGFDSEVSALFGKAPFFAVVDIGRAGPKLQQIVPSPCSGKHRPGVVPHLVRRLGPQFVLASHLGQRAHTALSRAKIDCRQVPSGTLWQAMDLWLRGDLSTPLRGDHNCDSCCEGSDGCSPGKCGGCGQTEKTQ